MFLEVVDGVLSWAELEETQPEKSAVPVKL